MKNVSVWSRSRQEPPFLPGAGADPIWSEPEPTSAPGPLTSRAGAAKKSSGSATLIYTYAVTVKEKYICGKIVLSRYLERNCCYL